MSKIYVFDACALIVLLSKETGYENVEKIINEAKDKKAKIIIHKINLYEVYYHNELDTVDKKENISFTWIR